MKITVSARIDVRYLAVLLPKLHEWGLNPRTKSELFHDCLVALHAILVHNHGPLPLPSFADAISELASYGFVWEEGGPARAVRLNIETEQELPPVIAGTQSAPGEVADEMKEKARRIVEKHRAKGK